MFSLARRRRRREFRPLIPDSQSLRDGTSSFIRIRFDGARRFINTEQCRVSFAVVFQRWLARIFSARLLFSEATINFQRRTS